MILLYVVKARHSIWHIYMILLYVTFIRLSRSDFTVNVSINEFCQATDDNQGIQLAKVK